MPSPVSDERLAQLDRTLESWEDLVAGRMHGVHDINRTGRDNLRDLLKHLAFLTALVHDLSADGAVAQWRAGYEAGRKEAYAACLTGGKKWAEGTFEQEGKAT